MKPLWSLRLWGSCGLVRAEQTGFVPSNLRQCLGPSRIPSCGPPVARRLHEQAGRIDWAALPNVAQPGPALHVTRNEVVPGSSPGVGFSSRAVPTDFLAAFQGPPPGLRPDLVCREGVG